MIIMANVYANFFEKILCALTGGMLTISFLRVMPMYPDSGSEILSPIDTNADDNMTRLLLIYIAASAISVVLYAIARCRAKRSSNS